MVVEMYVLVPSVRHHLLPSVLGQTREYVTLTSGVPFFSSLRSLFVCAVVFEFEELLCVCHNFADDHVAISQSPMR